MSEKEFTARLTRGLRDCNAVVCVIHQTRYSTPGTPDRYVVHRRWHGMLEFKDDDTKLRPDQRVVIREMNRRRPGSALVVRAPGVVEDEAGGRLGTFTTALELLAILEALSCER